MSDESSINYVDIQERFINWEFQKILKYTRNHCLNEYTLLITVSEIKHKTVLLTINYYFVILELKKIKNKRVSV